VAGLGLGCPWAGLELGQGCGLAVAGLGSGRLPASRSIWQALEKQMIRQHETDTFWWDLQNRSFRLCGMPTFRTPSSHPPWMTQARLARWQPRKSAVKINVRASAAECDFFTRPRNSSDQIAFTKYDTFALHSNLFENRAVPGQAGPGQAGPGWSGTPARAGFRPAARFDKLQKNS
jgi:hypothetical protein